MKKVIKEWNITYCIFDGIDGLDDFFIVLPSYLKVLWWFITKGRKACQIEIVVTGRLRSAEDLSYENS